MSNLQVIENKISFIRQHLSEILKYKKAELEDIKKDTILKSAIERELYVIVQAVIDLAEAFIAFKNFRKPTTMREAIDILAETGVLPREFTEAFRKMVGFRNALAHNYEDLKLEIVVDVLKTKINQVETYLDYLEKSLR